MSRFTEFVRERRYLHNVSPATVSWYTHAFKWLLSESPTQDELKNVCVAYRPIKRAFARHWIPYDALRYWKEVERAPLKTVLHEIREARNGVHAHFFQKDLATRKTVKNVTFVVDAMYWFLEVKSATKESDGAFVGRWQNL